MDQLRTESARWREQNNQSEQSRHELELNWRQTETRQRELAERLEAKENELRWVQSNAHEQQETAFRAQAAQFETSDGELRGELARLRSELEERQKSTEQTQAQQAIAEEQHSAALAQQETRLHNEISDLHNRLAHQQDQVEKAHSELSGLHAEVSGLRERSAGAEMTRAELDHHAALIATSRDELAASLQAKENELQATRATQLIANQRLEQISQDYAAQIENLNAEISRQSAALQEHEPALTRQEQLLRSEIESLIREAQEKSQILQNRNDELVRAKSERDMLQERVKDLESATNQNEAAASEESEQMRTEFQAQLALLQAELSQKEWALEEQCASVSGLDQQYREQIEGLNQKLAQAEAPAQQDPDPFVIDTDKINGAQQRYSQHAEVAEMPTRGSNYPHLALGSRRWRTRLDRKRRWRTSSAVAQSSYQEILVDETKKDRNFRKDSQ
jgi:chromosome segregation ATPase